MIDKELLTKTIEDAIAGTDLFLVDLKITPDNTITVELDSATGVDIDSCAKVTRAIEFAFDRDAEDYELEVGSAGITSPLKIRAQFDKYLGKDLEILTKEGRKLRGVLVEVAEGDPADTAVDFVIEMLVKVKEPGAKRPVVKQEPVSLNSSDCKYVKYDLKF